MSDVYVYRSHERRRAVTALLLGLASVLSLVVHLNLQFATCSTSSAGVGNASSLLVVVVGFGRIGQPTCSIGGREVQP
jgi:hypothetical protein